MRLVLENSRTHCHKGQIKSGIDFIPEPGEKSYARNHIQFTVFPDTTAPLNGYPGEKVWVPEYTPIDVITGTPYDVAAHWKAVDQEDYDRWVEALPKIWQATPCLTAFIGIDENITKELFDEFVRDIYTPDVLATIDNIMAAPLTDNPHFHAHLISPFCKDKTTLSTRKVTSFDGEAKDYINQRLGGVDLLLPANGKAAFVTLKSLDIGAAAIDRASSFQAGYTLVEKSNPANNTGNIDTWQLYFLSSDSGADVEVTTLYVVSGNNLSTRDSETIGSVSGGATRTFTGLSTSTVTGDYAGLYFTSGKIEAATTGGSGLWYKAGDYIPCTNEAFTALSGYVLSIYGTGTDLPTVTTQAASDIEATIATGNGNITDTGGENADHRGIVYGTSSQAAPGNVAPAASGYDDYEDEPGSFSAGAFTRSLTGLDTGVTYYARAYAHNSKGYAYGDEVSFLTKPAAPTNVAATDGAHTDKVVVTWTKSTGATGYKVYRGAVLVDTLGDVEAYDDTGAAAPVITPGAAAATDGTYLTKIVVSVLGESVANGTTYTYKVVAVNASGDSADSATDTGYRGHGALTYQWQRSAADSDADYANISGATTDPYSDYAAPADEGRYYKCVLSATGAANATSTSNRGYRKSHPSIQNNIITLQARDADGVLLADILDAYTIHPTYQVNELSQLKLSVPGDCAARAHFADPNEVWIYKDGILEDIFCIYATEKVRARAAVINVDCQGVGYTLKKTTVMGYSDTETATNHLTALLALQETPTITLGGVSPVLDFTFALDVDQKDIWQGCLDVQKTTGGYLFLTFDPDIPSTRQLWLMADIGEDKGQQIRINKNLLSVSHRTDYIELYNKLRPVGAGSLSLNTKTYTRADVAKSADASYGYLTLQEKYGAYKDWTGEGGALPANVTVEIAGGGWVGLTGYSDAGGWTGPTLTYDGNTGTYAYIQIAPWAYSGYIVLTIGATTATAVRIYNRLDANGYLDVDIYYGAAWHNLGLLPRTLGWQTISFGSQSITGVRIRGYNPSEYTNYATIYEVEVWGSTGYADDSANWEQGANENVLRCAIGDYDADAPYVISYTHAAYLIAMGDISSRAQIYSAAKALTTDNVDTLRAQGCVYLEQIKTPVVSIDVDHIDLSVEEGKAFEKLQMGSIVSIIVPDLDITASARVVRIEKPDLGNHPEKIKISVGTVPKTIIDYMLQ